jgi:hypothetical protein
MTRITVLALVAVFSICQSQASLKAQDVGEFLGVDILRPTASDFAPELFMKDQVRNVHASLKLAPEGLLLRNNTLAVTGMIAHDATAYSLMLKKDGIGIGTFLPQAALHMSSNGSSTFGFPEARILLENRHNTTAMRTMFRLMNNGPSRFEFENTNSDETWTFQTNASDNFMINRLGSGGNEFSIRRNGMVTMGPGAATNFILQPNGNLEIAGSISQSSDRNQKTAIRALDVNRILEGVNRLPLSSWQYKDDASSIRHAGPMAQDFHSEFQFGTNDKTLSSIDTGGVALAAIQALSNQLEEKEQRIDQLESEMNELRQMLAGMQQ